MPARVAPFDAIRDRPVCYAQMKSLADGELTQRIIGAE